MPAAVKEKVKFGATDPRRDPRWRNDAYARVFDLARRGHDKYKMAEALGVDLKTFKKWVGNDEALSNAISEGRRTKILDEQAAERVLTTGPTFAEYVYGRLPDDLKPIWDEIYPEPGFGLLPEKIIDGLFRDKGEWARKHLYLHALTQFSFNPTEAGRRVNVSHKEVKKWVREDPDFGRLLVEVLGEVKKDFVEGSLFDLIRRGSEQATIFAAKTLLKDRGYGAEMTVKHQGGILHASSNIDDWPIELRKQFLEYMRGRKKQEAITQREDDE